jgi:RNA polymerase sigma-70 factor (ECF subfamily)
MSAAEFNFLVLANAEILRPFAVSLTKDKELANDLYQETMYKAFANRNKYAVGTNIKAWLYTIMRNTFINEYRRKAKRYIVSMDVSNEYSMKQNQGLSFNRAESKIAVDDIIKKVNNLPSLFKNPFKLYFEGYKYQEIAYAMNEPLGTIKSRIHFARKLLKEQINHH